MLKTVFRFSFVRKYLTFKSKEANVLYFLYLFGMGGLLYEPEINLLLKIAYLPGLMLPGIYGLVTAFPCFYHEMFKSKSEVDSVYLLEGLLYSLVLPAGLMFNILTFVFRKKILNAIRSVDANVDLEEVTDETDNQDIVDATTWTTTKKRAEVDIGDMAERIFNLNFFFCCWYVSVKFACSLFAVDRQKVAQNRYYYIAPVWGIDSVSTTYTTFMIYTLVHTIQYYFVLLLGPTAIPIYTATLGEIYMNYHIKITNVLASESRRLTALVEFLDERTLSNKLAANRAARIKERAFATYERKCIRFLRNVRKLRKAVNEIKSYIEIVFIASCMSNFIYSPCLTYIVLHPDVPIFHKVAKVVIIFSVLIIFYPCCYVGKMLDDANELLIDSIYDTPWYYLDAKRQKVIYLILYEAQQNPPRLVALFIYPVAMVTFPRVLNLNYTITNMIRTFQARH